VVADASINATKATDLRLKNVMRVTGYMVYHLHRDHCDSMDFVMQTLHGFEQGLDDQTSPQQSVAWLLGYADIAKYMTRMGVMDLISVHWDFWVNGGRAQHVINDVTNKQKPKTVNDSKVQKKRILTFANEIHKRYTIIRVWKVFEMQAYLASEYLRYINQADYAFTTGTN
jgi:hypothetical protein